MLKQESVIFEVMSCVSMVAERYSELRTNENYIIYINAMDNTSRLICNDSVTKLNREPQMFPTSLLTGIFGFRQRDYLEAVEERVDISGIR